MDKHVTLLYCQISAVCIWKKNLISILNFRSLSFIADRPLFWNYFSRLRPKFVWESCINLTKTEIWSKFCPSLSQNSTKMVKMKEFHPILENSGLWKIFLGWMWFFRAILENSGHLIALMKERDWWPCNLNIFFKFVTFLMSPFQDHSLPLVFSK